MAREPWRIDRQIGVVTPWMKHVTGRFYGSQCHAGAQVGTITPAVNTLYAQPFFVPSTKTYNSIQLEVVGQDADNLTRLGIYNNGSSVPGSLLVDAGTVSLTGAGAKTASTGMPLSITGPAWYWLAYVSDSGTATYRGYTVTNSLPLIGIPSGTLTGTNTNFFAWSVAFTFAALPDPFTGSGALSQAAAAAVRVLLEAG